MATFQLSGVPVWINLVFLSVNAVIGYMIICILRGTD